MAWSKNEGRFEFHRNENKIINKMLQKSCNMLTTCLKNTVSNVFMPNSVKKYYILVFFLISGVFPAACTALR